MKRFTILLVAMLGVAILASAALAENEDKGKRARVKDRKEMRKKMEAKYTKELGLSEKQVAQLKQLRETHRQAIQNWRKENGGKLKDLHKKLREARKSDDEKKIKDIRAQLAKLRTSQKKLHENFQKQLSEVLTKEQMAKHKKMMQKRFRHRHPRMAKMAGWNKLGLTDKQKAKAKDIRVKAKAKADKTDDPAAKAKIMREAWESIRKDVLTDKQRKQLAAARKKFAGPFAGLNLTEEQRKKIKAIHEEQRKKFKATREETKKKVNAVLTSEQRKKMEEMRKKWQKRRRSRTRPHKGQRRPGRGGPGKGGPGKGGPGRGPDRDDEADD